MKYWNHLLNQNSFESDLTDIYYKNTNRLNGFKSCQKFIKEFSVKINKGVDTPELVLKGSKQIPEDVIQEIKSLFEKHFQKMEAPFLY